MHNLPGTPREQRAAYVAMVLSEPPVNEPGSQNLYSNRNYAVAGAIAEKIANDSWENLMQKRIFKPLGMQTCGFGAMGTPGITDPKGSLDRSAMAAHGRDARRPQADRTRPAGRQSSGRSAPPAQCIAPMVDWGKFITAHLRGEQGEPGILKPETFKRLHTPPFGGDYGFGWLVVDRPWAGGRALNHAGSNTQNFAIVWMAPPKISPCWS